jgi:hypothetical protein
VRQGGWRRLDVYKRVRRVISWAVGRGSDVYGMDPL